FGLIQDGTIKNLELENIAVVGRHYTGALAGAIVGEGIVERVNVRTGNVNGSTQVGGLVGNLTNARMEKSSANISVAGNLYYVGGLVGYMTGANVRISESYAVGNARGSYSVGGLVGYIVETSANVIRVENSFALGSAEGTHSNGYVGGLIGHVSASSSAHTSVKNSYSAGKVTSPSSNKGGLIGAINTSIIADSYFNKTVTGFDNPASQARTTEEMMQMANFSAWDFTEIWAIENGSSYPYLRKLIVPQHENMPDRSGPFGLQADIIESKSINLVWEGVSWAESYEIRVNGQLIATVVEPMYTHDNLTPGTVYEYKVRGINNGIPYSWTPTLRAVTLIDIPENFTITKLGDTHRLTWDSVDGALAYDIKINGVMISSITETTYIHDNLMPNSQNIYQIRARNDITNSKWSEIKEAMYREEGTSGISIIAVNWLDDLSQEGEVEIIIKAYTEDLYSVAFDLIYDTVHLNITSDSIENLLVANDEYYYSVHDEIEGRIRILVSKTGEEAGSGGEISIIRLRLKLESTDISQLQIQQAKIVNSLGELVNIPNVAPLNITIHPEHEGL
ncbi:hypothetical protein, partial [Alkaliphilus serpentinus]|uniref:hypothetical protein n=1 Tax=Alkaliphilus serpentinus TaxID=1482731 RepID=UPI0038B78475